MFIPIRTDRPQRHTPYVTFALLVTNMVVFALTIDQISQISRMEYEGYSLARIVREVPVFRYFLDPMDMRWYQFLSYQFLHNDVMHIAGNMLFLWVFARNIEDRLGHIGFLAFYLAGGVISGLGHCAVEAAPVLGASGSVAAVTGAFLALFPMTRITILFVFFLIAFYEIPSMYLILLSFGFNIFQQFMGGGNVAYLAHISGYVFGFAIGMGLLATRILPREPYDFLALMDRWNRRRQLRALANRGHSPWQTDATAMRKPSKSRTAEEPDQRVVDARHAVSAALESRDMPAALDAFERLVRLDPKQVMHRQAQLDLANQAMQSGHHRTAAHAYEGFLETYPYDGFADEVRLILGLIDLRYLDNRQRARELLTTAVERLRDENRVEQARRLLDEAGGPIEKQE